MALFDIFRRNQLDEAIKAFDNMGNSKTRKQLEQEHGEGIDDVLGMQTVGYGNVGLTSFNTFYNSTLNQQFKNELERINTYREIADCPEVADIIEDAINETIHENDDGKIIHIKFTDKKLVENENMVNTLNKEFDNLFYKKLNMQEKMEDMLRTYLVDGRMFYERIIDEKNKSQGIQNIKKLPSETMDYEYDPKTGETLAYFQYLTAMPTRPKSMEELKQRKDVIVFYPEQIGMVNYGIYGKTKYEMLGYLEKVKIPYNQLKLLETSVIIYRIIRAPERLVFRIDTGNMPRDKSMKFVEKIKQKMTKKQTFDPKTGTLSQDPEITSLLENYFLPQCLRISNTYIDLLDGRKILLKDLIKEYNEGKKHEVYSVDQKTGKIIRGNVEWAGITRRNAKLVRVYLDNGKYVDTTPDHKFVMRNGSEVEAQNLKENDSLMPLYKKDGKVLDIYSKKWLNVKTYIEYKESVINEVKNFIRPNIELYNNHKVVKVEKLSIRDDTGCLTIKDTGNNHNFGLSVGVFVKNSADGRGSQIETVGGNSAGFTELDDIYYFQRKLYRALKYPLSRISAGEEKREADIMFGGGSTAEISRDEVKWAKFLERQQKKFCDEFRDLFLLHLDFKGIKEQYKLTKKSFKLWMEPPSNYKEQMAQNLLETRFNNYSVLADRDEFSLYWMMKKYLHMSDEDIKENIEGLKKDKELGLKSEEGGY